MSPAALSNNNNNTVDEGADELFLPTDTHQLTPYASPVSEKRCVEIYCSALLCSMQDEQETPVRSPVRYYMPRRVSGHGASNFEELLDGDVTPPLQPKPTVQVVSPSLVGLPLELCCEERYQQSSEIKRKRAAERMEERPSKRSCGSISPFAKPSLDSLLLRRNLDYPMMEIPELPSLTTIANDLDQSSTEFLSQLSYSRRRESFPTFPAPPLSSTRQFKA